MLPDPHPCYLLSHLYSQKAYDNTAKRCVYLYRKAEYKKLENQLRCSIKMIG